MTIAAEAEPSRRLADRLLEYFPRTDAADDSGVALTIRQVSGPGFVPPLPDSAQLLYESPAFHDGESPSITASSVYRHDAGVTVKFRGLGSVTVNGDAGRSVVHLVEPVDAEDDSFLYCVHFGLVEVLKRRGLYTIHSAALERDGKAVLIAGASGQGKTTSCLSLVRGGFRCLADDHPFLRDDGGQVGVYAFPEPMAVTDTTREIIPELRPDDAPLQKGERKWNFRLEELYGANVWAVSAAPRVILFPQVIQWPKSYVEPLSKAQCLQELLPHGFRILNREVATAHFRLLARLADQAPAYRMYVGEDVLALPDLIGPLLAK